PHPGSRPLLSVTSFRDDLPSPPLRVLLLGERPLAPLERILARAQLDAKRRAPELERLAQRILEIALVRPLDLVQRGSVDDDDRRVRAALVRVAQLRPEAPGERRLLLLDGCLYCAREARRGELRHRRG